MLNPEIGDVLTRITPPGRGFEGYAQSGKVVEVTDTAIVVEILVDMPRRMTFSRKDGTESVFGTFLVRPDWIR